MKASKPPFAGNDPDAVSADCVESTVGEANPPFSEVYLASLSARFDATRKGDRDGNPLVVWGAILWCLGEHPKTELPGWCLDYLERTARRLNTLACADHSEETGGKGRGHAPATPTAGKLLRVLGFSSKGRNAFWDAWGERRKQGAAVRYMEMRKAGVSAKDALPAVMEWLGVDDEDQAKRDIRAGKRLLGVKT